MGYFKDIKLGIETTAKGMSLTLRHLLNARQSRTPISVQDPDYFKQDVGITTLQFPHESIAVPDNGRYQLDCEIDDCIVCDKCAKVCPVDCIDIEPIKSNGIIDYASDGSPIRLYAGRFDIDMAKCCFCGLCTTVCPTECLTMTNQYDFSVVDVADMNFEFSNLSPEQAEEKKKLYNDYVAAKEAFKAIPKESIPEVEMPEKKPKTTFKPTIRPVVKPAAEIEKATDDEPVSDAQPKPAFKPAFKPVMKQKPAEAENIIPEEVPHEEAPKPKTSFKPVFKTAAKPAEVKPENIVPEETAPAEEAPKPRASFKPVFKTAAKPAEVEPTVEESAETELPKAELTQTIEAEAGITGLEKPIEAGTSNEETPKPKPAFTPKFRAVAVAKPTEVEPKAEEAVEVSAPEILTTIEAKAKFEIVEVEKPVEIAEEESSVQISTVYEETDPAIVEPEKSVIEDVTDKEPSTVELVPMVETIAKPEETVEPEKPVVEENATEAEPLPDTPEDTEPTISLFGDFAPKDTPKPKAKWVAKPAASQSLFDLDSTAAEKAPKETPKPKGKSAPKPPKQQSLFDFGSPED